jgi:hypothetical protein
MIKMNKRGAWMSETKEEESVRRVGVQERGPQKIVGVASIALARPSPYTAKINLFLGSNLFINIHIHLVLPSIIFRY